MILQWLLRAAFIGNLLFSVAVSVYVLSGYARRAFSGDVEARWLGRHITAIAASHLGLLAWITARFLVAGNRWEWWWVAILVAVFALSDYGLVQLYMYRRWKDAKRDGRAQAK